MILHPPASDRLQGLDRLRGLAILMVIAAHYLVTRQLSGPPPLSTFIATLGRGGVFLFFLLSGYLIHRTVTQQDTGRFLLRRFSKIFPAYWVNIGVIALMGVLAPRYPQHSISVYLTNMLMIPKEIDVRPLSGVYWTLFVEVKFYLLAGLFQYFVRRYNWRQQSWDWLLLGLLLIHAGVFFWHGKGFTVLYCLPCFFIGISLSRAETEHWSPRALFHLSATTVLVSLPFLTAPSYGVCSVLYLLCLTPLFAQVLRSGRFPDFGLQFLGKVSYSHYLYHTALGYWLMRVTSPHWPAGEMLLCLLVALLMTGVAWLGYRLVEVPCVAAGRWLEQRLWPTPGSAPAAPR